MNGRHAARPRLLPSGVDAVLVECAGLDEVLLLHDALAADPPDGLVELVPAARTLLVSIDPARLPLESAAHWIETTQARRGDGPQPAGSAVLGVPAAEALELSVVYDGDDLAETAEWLGVSPEALVAAHTAARWRVAFTGFAPGFGYLVSPDWTFDVPRLDSPRTRVPTGSVALAGTFAGVYPRESPGGWRLIGRTAAPLWDAAADQPAQLVPARAVRFRAAAGAAPAAAPVLPAPDVAAPAAAASDTERRGILVERAGPLTLVEDLGRPGRAALGVARSGALDRGALALANRLVGNRPDAAGLELLLGGFRARFDDETWFATAGAWGALRLDGRVVPPYAATRAPAGGVLEIEPAQHGLRYLLAVRGGIDVPVELGSRSTDTLARLGPPPVRDGDRLPVGAAVAGSVPALDQDAAFAPPDDTATLALLPGPRAEWFTEGARAILFETVWRMSSDSDRVGARLNGPALERVDSAELPSEATVPGSIQVAADGRPMILNADRPVTGGYPVIAIVAPRSLDAVAQLRPGQAVQFRHA